MHGFLFIDKEKGMTSFDVIRILKRKLPKKYKIGHCGTLDPIATGLMIVAIGEATKLLEFLLGADKVYMAQCEFGAVSDTYDADGEVKKMAKAKPVTLDMIKKVVQQKFNGEISQMPPRFSAKKINGKRACDLARQGKEFELKEKKVSIYNFDYISFQWPFLEFEMACSSGTYVRSLVHDLGQELKVGAYMTSLRRTEIGFLEGGLNRGFSVDEAIRADDVDFETNPEVLRSIEEVFENYDYIDLVAPDFKRLNNGGFVLNTKNVQGDDVLAFYRGKVVGVVESMKGGKFIKLRKKLNISS